MASTAGSPFQPGISVHAVFVKTGRGAAIGAGVLGGTATGGAMGAVGVGMETV